MIPDATTIPASLPLRGYLIRESAGHIWIQDPSTLWVIPVNDVVARGTWSGVSDPRYKGEPGIYYVRDGANIQSITPVKVRATIDAPLAAMRTADGCEVNGLSGLEALAVAKLRELEITADARMTYTYCTGPDHKKYICDNKLM